VWAWEGGEVLGTLTPEHRQELTAAVASLHGALSRKDVDATWEALRLKSLELRGVMGRSPAETEAEQRQFFTDLFASTGWAFAPLHPEMLRFFWINDRVVKAENLDGTEPLRSQPFKDLEGRGALYTIPLYLSRIDGAWQIVR
jgi:hypothetical protein